MHSLLIIKREGLSWLLLVLLFWGLNSLHAQSNELIISEIMAVNNTFLPDEDGEYSDWIEIFNPGDHPVELDGWYLTDNPENLSKWKFPPMRLNSGSYLLVYASEKNKMVPSSNLHTNFKLSGSGEFLALIHADGITVSSSFGSGFPSQRADVSYGLYNGQYTFFKTPTPGGENSTGDAVSPPLFSHQRGFYNSPISLSLTSVDGNSEIFYSTNGNRPSASTGVKYTTPLVIDKTTVLSAVSVDQTSGETSEVVSNTFLFVEDILIQSNSPLDYPSVWGSGYAADYEMDPEICTSENKPRIIQGFQSIPTISLVTDVANLFSDSTDPYTGGIYINSLSQTDEWERPVSLEFMDPASGLNFQINCGLRLHGGNSRKPGNSPKHGFRVSFRSQYGPSKLNFNVFDEKGAANEFNNLVLRAGYNYSWVKNSPVQCNGADYLKDPFAKQTQLDMEREAAHQKFAHLFLNGLYWGLYNISEKINNDFMEAYLGGHPEDYDVVNDDGSSSITDGTWAAWQSLLTASGNGFESLAEYQKVQGKNADGSVNASYSNLLDVKNFIDYLIVNYYIGNKDWDSNNWFAGRNRLSNEFGFRFFCWDSETSMDELNVNRVAVSAGPNNPTGIHSRLKANEEYLLQFADRIHKHFFNDGALTPQSARDRYLKLAGAIETAIWGESARWGDYRRDVDGGSAYELYTPDKHWQPNVDYMMQVYFPQRTAIVLEQFKSAGLYPDLSAPEFNHPGGDISDPVELSMTAPDGEIYYTLDDSDPRQPGGTLTLGSAFYFVNPFWVNSDLTVKARVKRGNEWSAMARVKFKWKGTVSDIPRGIQNSVVDHSCVPNPVVDHAAISFVLPQKSWVNVSIVNMEGLVVKELFSGEKSIGNHCLTWHPDQASSGVYFYRISYMGSQYSGKLILVK